MSIFERRVASREDPPITRRRYDRSIRVHLVYVLFRSPVFLPRYLRNVNITILIPRRSTLRVLYIHAAWIRATIFRASTRRVINYSARLFFAEIAARWRARERRNTVQLENFNCYPQNLQLASRLWPRTVDPRFVSGMYRVPTYL